MEHTMEVEPPERNEVERPVKTSKEQLISDEYHNSEVDERGVGHEIQTLRAGWKDGKSQIDGDVAQRSDDPPNLVSPAG
jgi:hypothetical protein